MDNSNNLVRAKLVRYLNEEIECANALLQSLKAESAALSSSDPKLVTINSANKINLIEALQQASNYRISHMNQHGLSYPDVQNGISVDTDFIDATLQDLTTQLSELAQLCFLENRRIGQLINRRTQFITQLLRNLSPSPSQKGLTYEKNGTTTTDSHGTLLHVAKI